jgi:hypothetical protein
MFYYLSQKNVTIYWNQFQTKDFGFIIDNKLFEMQRSGVLREQYVDSISREGRIQVFQGEWVAYFDEKKIVWKTLYHSLVLD